MDVEAKEELPRRLPKRVHEPCPNCALSRHDVCMHNALDLDPRFDTAIIECVCPCRAVRPLQDLPERCVERITVKDLKEKLANLPDDGTVEFWDVDRVGDWTELRLDEVEAYPMHPGEYHFNLSSRTERY